MVAHIGHLLDLGSAITDMSASTPSMFFFHSWTYTSLIWSSFSKPPGPSRPSWVLTGISGA